MHLGLGLGSLFALAVIATVAVALLAPFAVLGAGVWILVRCVGALTQRRGEVSIAAPVAAADADERRLAWAAGLLVTGGLWIVGHFHFAAILLGLGAALLTRGVLERRRRAVA